MSEDTQFETVIGLEVHAQLLSESKAFAAVSNRFGSAPNTNVTPLCLGHPGTLPVPNENLIRYAVRLGLATNCSIARKSIFARKNYFYPDMPKGYQISQFETPICYDGHLDVELEDGSTRRIGLTRIHMEEDAGKSIHDQDPHNTLIDLNRAGTPLLEIVSEPDIRSPEEAGAYMRKIWQMVRYLGVCDGNMEEGSLRCDANVSIRPAGQKEFSTRTEIKNLNSFRNVERALAYEVERQKEVVRSGGEVVQQTLLWDPNDMKTRQMRTKEEAHDYRYFPEPDIPPVVVSEEMLEEIRLEIPELPEARRKRYMSEYKLSDFDAAVLTEDRPLADFFEAVLEQGVPAKPAANLIITELRRVMNERGISIAEFPVGPERLAGLIRLREDDKISSSAMQTLLDAMLDSDKDAETLAGEKNLLQVSDTGFLDPIVDQVLQDNPEEVKRYLGGKQGLIGFFIGQVMKQSRGKANPGMVREMIQKKISDYE
ncbi:Asp-tRNA(Asn)/Glu-tRNA(Gln) amidotransferase subunit GatB [Natronogracilivirga saccharolytica]|uniref:Aspartyl/glutamyl-tRNA(Asn/Gln) amidotransferase subunit B n=1 Tax=Natronogracilivirga saccharolytica TaxID=2812953 RepID=A0A8J7RJU9_9BACT|nr:Asp-tRNA(Asn)/Glu-tRNA(Gln) amidotransferase subunit GatB [Natronogracilivirga saccharolytica]MBP3192562.1 Asp-tRNA(Asn)/Glu-tRNA(Gln) amidotransferase subunit GatB [Natronogracilivirga saccharolytica]